MSRRALGGLFPVPSGKTRTDSRRGSASPRSQLARWIFSRNGHNSYSQTHTHTSHTLLSAFCHTHNGFPAIS